MGVLVFVPEISAITYSYFYAATDGVDVIYTDYVDPVPQVFFFADFSF